MAGLKDYWNSIPTSSNEEIDIDGAYASVSSRIHRHERRKYLGIAVAAAVVALLSVWLIVPVSPKPEMLQCTAPLGEHRQVELSDGTVVTLNSGSTLVYLSSYRKGQRNVSLSGEASFNVAKNPRQPFVVKTKDFDVRVLGTVFNVSSYPDKTGSSVVLESGSVVILSGSNELVLAPGQKADFDADNDFSITNVQASDYFAWERGGFVQKQASIYDIIDFIHRTYDVQVHCSFSENYLDAVITCKSDTRLDLQDYLSLLSELIPGMKYKTDETSVTLY